MCVSYIGKSKVGGDIAPSLLSVTIIQQMEAKEKSQIITLSSVILSGDFDAILGSHHKIRINLNINQISSSPGS